MTQPHTLSSLSLPLSPYLISFDLLYFLCSSISFPSSFSLVFFFFFLFPSRHHTPHRGSTPLSLSRSAPVSTPTSSSSATTPAKAAPSDALSGLYPSTSAILKAGSTTTPKLTLNRISLTHLCGASPLRAPPPRGKGDTKPPSPRRVRPPRSQGEVGRSSTLNHPLLPLSIW
jgi:hypothetical protein